MEGGGGFHQRRKGVIAVVRDGEPRGQMGFPRKVPKKLGGSSEFITSRMMELMT